MKQIRQSVFETNSSSTHSLSLKKCKDNDYVSPNSKIVVNFICTESDTRFWALSEKISYIVTHIANRYKYSSSYEEMKELIEIDYDFNELYEYVKEKYGKEIVLPEKCEFEYSNVILINHQLECYDLSELLMSIITGNIEMALDLVLDEKYSIEIGHD